MMVRACEPDAPLPSPHCRLMFALLGVNFGTLAFRSPARRALIPQLVPREQLHLAATLQAFVYSLIVSRLPPECRGVSHVLPADAPACLHAEQGRSAAWSGLLLQCATDTGWSGLLLQCATDTGCRLAYLVHHSLRSPRRRSCF